jgi:hypothetical protein
VALALAVAMLLAACGREEPTAEGQAAPVAAADTTAVPTTAAPTTTTTTEPPTTTTTAQVAGSPVGPGANTLYVLGDSVILGAQTTVPPALVGWDVTFDAKESRRIDQGIGILQAKGGQVGRVLVVHLCTNWGGGDYGAAADQLLGSLVGVDRVVWVTCTPWIPAVGSADDAIKALPSRHPNVVVADWAAWSASAGFTYNDGLHLQPTGARAMAMLVAAAVGPAPA